MAAITDWSKVPDASLKALMDACMDPEAYKKLYQCTPILTESLKTRTRTMTNRTYRFSTKI